MILLYATCTASVLGTILVLAILTILDMIAAFSAI